jgi:TonB family protein
VVEPQSKPYRSSRLPGDSARETLSDRSGNLDERAALTALEELIAAGDHSLDPMLAAIADAARQLTGASGAALAMWKDGAMMCRARSGDTAPALGARLSANTGISGECLRTGKIQHCADSENNPLVDVEVCRSLGLRSIAVLPIRGGGATNGILEVFSTRPGAFTEPHIALLQQLAALAERARATQPREALPVVKPPSGMEKQQPSGFLPASDSVGDVALAAIGSGRRSRALVFGAIGTVAILLLALAIWLGYRGPDEADGQLHAAAPTSVGAGSVDSVNASNSGGHSSDQNPTDQHLSDKDPVWKTNPGGESLMSSRAKPSAGAPVKLATKVDVIEAKNTPADASRLQPSDARIDSRITDTQPSEAAPAEPPPIPASAANPSSLNTVLSAKASLPRLAAPTSLGVSGGQIVHRVAPIYPAQALVLHLEGTVILAAVIIEDGTLRDVRVIEGEPLLAQSALDAVKNWRYKPYELDGKPVKNLIRISVDFKFPEQLNH